MRYYVINLQRDDEHEDVFEGDFNTPDEVAKYLQESARKREIDAEDISEFYAVIRGEEIGVIARDVTRTVTVKEIAILGN